MPGSAERAGGDPGEQHEVLGKAHERWIAARYDLELWMPKPYVVVVRGRGHATGQHVDRVIEWRERALKSGRSIVLFDDLEKMPTYDSEVRIRLTAWVATHRTRIEAMHILLRSKMARMGVSVANLALGGFIKAHIQRDEFERELKRYIG